ncbi:MAG: hypothetical protein ACI9T8_000400 [Candidatus Saccharimonadales bacterium]|jgi:uncharacterized protein (TIGR02453 family)
MQYFTKEYIDFFTELAFNNEKSWFDANRHRYEEHVREPLKKFIIDLIAEIQKFDKSIGHLEPKDVMFRINRDVRFAKDKTPYNTWLSAAIVPGGKRNSQDHPGYYFRFAVDKVSLGGGMYHPSKELLYSLRSKLSDDSKPLHKIVNSKKFKSAWGELEGDENKVMPKEFKEASIKEPFIKKKGFMYWQDYSEMEVLREDLMEWMINHFKAGKDLNQWLRD